MKTIDSGSATSRLAAQKPVDRPVSLMRERRGRGFPRLGTQPCSWQLLGPLLPRYCLCPTEHVQGARETRLGTANLSAGDILVRDTKQSTSSPHLLLLHTRAHTRSLTHTHTLLTSEMMTAPLHTLHLVVLGFLLPLFLSRCPADHTHPLFQKTPNNSFHKLFLKERNKTEHKRGQEEENQPANQQTNKKTTKEFA